MKILLTILIWVGVIVLSILFAYATDGKLFLLRCAAIAPFAFAGVFGTAAIWKRKKVQL